MMATRCEPVHVRLVMDGNKGNVCNENDRHVIHNDELKHSHFLCCYHDYLLQICFISSDVP